MLETLLQTSIDETIKNAVQTIQERVRLGDQWKILLKYLPEEELEKMGAKFHFGGGLSPLYIRIPLMMANINQTDKLMKGAGFKERWERTIYESMVSVSWELENEFAKGITTWNCYITVEFRKEGDISDPTTCIIKKIGEKRTWSTQPVYEVICPEGAAEDIFKEKEVTDGEA
jgi:hypothetical protein